jgi:hypothetical protein
MGQDWALPHTHEGLFINSLDTLRERESGSYEEENNSVIFPAKKSIIFYL